MADKIHLFNVTLFFLSHKPGILFIIFLMGSGDKPSVFILMTSRLNQNTRLYPK